MSEPYRPSNSSEGEWFESKFCDHCQKDQEYRETADSMVACHTLTAGQVFDIGEAGFPSEWIHDEHGPRCTAFEPITVDPETGLARVQQVPGQLDIFGGEG